MARWQLDIDQISFGGLASQYWKENYPLYGNKNQASVIRAMDLTNNGYIQPGPAVAEYGGASAVSSLVTDFVYGGSNDKAFAVGGNAIYQCWVGVASKIHTISASTATISSGGFEQYQSNYYYGYTPQNQAAEIGRFDGTSTFTDRWWSGTLSATPLQTIAARPALERGANDVLYISNGRYVASYDGTTAQDKALDLPNNYDIADLRWMADRLIVAANYGNSDAIGGSIYIWDGTTDSWESEIPVLGRLGAGYVLNNVYYQFYEDGTHATRLAYLDGNRLVDLTHHDGYDAINDYHLIPSRTQVTDWHGFLIWVPGWQDDMFAWGSPSPGVPPRLFKFAVAQQDTNLDQTGAITNVINDPGLTFAQGTSLYYLSTYEPAGFTYETDSQWKSLLFDITSDDLHGGTIDGVRFNFEKLTSGASLDWSLVDNQGRTLYSDTISYAKATGSNEQHTLTTAYYPLRGLVAENFRIDLDYSGGSTTAPVRISSIKMYGGS